MRRIAKALEESNQLGRERLALEYPEWGRRKGLRRSPKIADLGVVELEDLNRGWRETHPEEEHGTL